jgi:adenylate kinase
MALRIVLLMQKPSMCVPPSGSRFRFAITRSFAQSAAAARSSVPLNPVRARETPIHQPSVPLPVNIVLFGAPGVGKGTYAKKIAPYCGIPHISTGDLVRAAVKKNPSLKEALEKGDLCSNDTITTILKERLDLPDAQRGVLLDGYPRSAEQVELLDKILKITCVLHLRMREDVLVRKLNARRVCSSCGEGYNLADILEHGLNMPAIRPQKDGICDKCGGTLVQRSDDAVDVIKHRLQVYKEVTEPVLSVYEARGDAIHFELTSGVADMWPLLRRLIDQQSWAEHPPK